MQTERDLSFEVKSSVDLTKMLTGLLMDVRRGIVDHETAKSITLIADKINKNNVNALEYKRIAKQRKYNLYKIMCSLLRNAGKNFLKKIESNIEEKLKEKKDWYTTKSEDDAIFNMFRGAVIQSTHNKKLIKELNRLMKKEEDENNQHGRVKQDNC